MDTLYTGLRVGRSPASLDIVRVYKDTHPFILTILDDEGNPANILGAAFFLWVHALSNPDLRTDPLLKLVGGVLDGPLGIMKFTPILEESGKTATGPPPGSYFYDVLMRTSTLVYRIIIQGQWIVLPRIVKWGRE